MRKKPSSSTVTCWGWSFSSRSRRTKCRRPANPTPTCTSFWTRAWATFWRSSSFPTRRQWDATNRPQWVQHIAFEVRLRRPARLQGPSRGKRHQRHRPHEPRHLRFDLLLRSQRPPAGIDRQQRHPCPARRVEARCRSDAGGMVPNEGRAAARPLAARDRLTSAERDRRNQLPSAFTSPTKPMNISSQDCSPQRTVSVGSGLKGFISELSKPPFT